MDSTNNNAVTIGGISYEKIEEDKNDKLMYLPSKGKFATQKELDKANKKDFWSIDWSPKAQREAELFAYCIGVDGLSTRAKVSDASSKIYIDSAVNWDHIKPLDESYTEMIKSYYNSNGMNMFTQEYLASFENCTAASEPKTASQTYESLRDMYYDRYSNPNKNGRSYPMDGAIRFVEPGKDFYSSSSYGCDNSCPICNLNKMPGSMALRAKELQSLDKKIKVLEDTINVAEHFSLNADDQYDDLKYFQDKFKEALNSQPTPATAEVPDPAITAFQNGFLSNKFMKSYFGLDNPKFEFIKAPQEPTKAEVEFDGIKILNKYNAKLRDKNIVFTGMTALDIFTGGFSKGTLTIIAGSVATCKTAIADEIIDSLNNRVIFTHAFDKLTSEMFLDRLAKELNACPAIEAVVIDEPYQLYHSDQALMRIRNLASVYNVAIIAIANTGRNAYQDAGESLDRTVMQFADKVIMLARDPEQKPFVKMTKVKDRTDGNSNKECYFNYSARKFTSFIV